MSYPDDRVLREYGLSREGYDAMLAAQNGRCAICRRSKDLYIDHCHTSGRVRGLLCVGCNTSLGKLGDTTQGVSRALAYLEPDEEKAATGWQATATARRHCKDIGERTGHWAIPANVFNFKCDDGLAQAVVAFNRFGAYVLQSAADVEWWVAAYSGNDGEDS